MKEVTIKYKSSKTLEALKELGKYLGFSVSEPIPVPKTDTSHINGVSLIQGDDSIDISALHDIFTGKELDSRDLRNKGWLRKR